LPQPHSARPSVALTGSAAVFGALGDETRLRLVSRLCDDGPMSIARLTEDAGLVRATRRGRESVWQLEQKRLAEARRYLDQISAQWDDALGRLKKFVER